MAPGGRRIGARKNALTEYCEQMRYRALSRARLVAEQTARREAEDAARVKSDFISMMSHELRTPLNSIIGFSEILSQPSTFLKDSERLNYAELINSSGKHLTSVVNSILEMSKIQSGAYEVDMEDRDLAHILGDVLASMDIAARKKGVTLISVWDRPVMARVDDTRLTQSVAGIIDNAVKFTEAGGTVTVACGHDGGGFAAITVSDTGIGMDAGELERALTPFGQVAGGHARGAEGSGLGLCIARELTALQNGRFAIHSERGKGTTVKFTFPPAPGASDRRGTSAGEGRRRLRRLAATHG